MTFVSVDANAVRDAIGGRVYVAGEGGYDAARLPWQRRLDPRPALIVEAANASDVRTAIRFAREQDLALAVQSTGHGAVRIPDGGLLLKTNPMSAVAIDAGRRVARVGGGALWSDVIAAAAPHGLAPLSGSSPTVGVTGYTLGGGTGWLSRLHGFAADSVRRFEVVTASGELVTASATEDPDLFWALRGGGGNFGVVTSLEFDLFPVASVYAGVAMFAPNRAAEALAAYRDWALDEPDESSTALVVAQLPPAPQLPEPVRGKRVLMLRSFYVGTSEEGRRVLAPLYEAAGAPLLDGMRSTSYADAAAMMPPPPPAISEMHVELFREIPDEAIDAAVEGAPGVMGIELRHWGGAMSRPDENAGPIGHRQVPFTIVAGGQAETPEDAERMMAGVRTVADKLRPHATGGSWLNFLGDATRTADAYTEGDYRRLRQVKAAYDPDNVFAANHNIPPAD
jgi:FAD/FMN-containing dehydrogenase